MLVRFYPLVIVLQVYCFYHMYKNHNDQRWFWLIFFLPFFGSLIYLYIHFYSSGEIENVGEGLKQAVNSNYHTQKLERELEVSDTFRNRMNLADAYLIDGRYEEALELYESCSSGINEDDPIVLMKMLRANYFLSDHYAVIELGEKLKGEKVFQRSEEKTGLAVSYFQTGNLEKAEETFKEMDTRFSNYNHRIEYAQFLMNTGRIKASKGLLYSLKEEFKLMDNDSKRQNKRYIRRVELLSKTLSNMDEV